jgi:hypothetical protein
MEQYSSKTQAQARVDRIRAFREELAALQSAGVLDLAPGQREQVDGHHDATLKDLAARFDVDITDSEKRISWGMRIASTVAGVALCAALVLFFYRIWGLLPIGAQVVFLIAAPLGSIASMELAARRERTLYYTSLFGVMAFAAAVLNLSALGQMFNLPNSPDAFLVWAVFGVALGYAYRLKLQLAAGLTCWIVYAGMEIMRLAGIEGMYTDLRVEPFLVGPAIALAIPAAVKRVRSSDFAWVYYMIGLAGTYIFFLAGATISQISTLPFSPHAVRMLYQLLGIGVASAAMYLGVQRGLSIVVNLSAGFFALYLYVRLFQWWWDSMPKYVFFLIIGLISLGLLQLFQRLRKSAGERRAA